jgi:hypothetical protein
MYAKTFLIPIAAFALTATTASAFSLEVLAQAGLSQKQIQAFETAQELRKEGDKNAALEVLAHARIDIETLESVREAMHARKTVMQTAIDESVKNNDYDAFIEAIDGSPLRDFITSPSDFVLFKEAHTLKEKGAVEEAHAIFSGLGLPDSSVKPRL